VVAGDEECLLNFGGETSMGTSTGKEDKLKLNSMALVRERTIPTLKYV
jgi:hypothetical protein